ncbi:MAG: acyltransferase family protein, partial [Pseudomonadota bacterium]|nr:acyltransferase family protein [Pseudomonadota bacterium]
MKNRLVAYEGLRFIFIIFMVLHHLDSFNDISIPSFTENIRKFCAEGFIGVNFFFMLSGLGCVLGYKARLETKETSCERFLLTRFIKIYPTYLLFLTGAVFLYYGGNFFNYIQQFIIHVLMCQTFPLSQNIAFGYNGVSWCVSATAFFYLIFCIIHRMNLKECVYSVLFLSLFIFINILYHSNDGNV